MSALAEVFKWMAAFGGVIFMLFIALNIMTKGFLFQYLRVKASQGRLILARMHSVTDTYYRPAKIVEGFLETKTRQKEQFSLPINDSDYSGYINRELGVSVIEIDEQAKKILNFDFKGVSFIDGFDAGRTQSLLMRIKNRPQPLNKNTTLILLGIFLTLVIVGFIAFRIIKLEEAIMTLGRISGNI